MRVLRLTAGLAAVILALAAAAPAQELSLSFGAGGLFPPTGDYREIYGSGLSFGGDVWLKFKGHFGFAAGFGFLSDKGLALVTGQGNVEYPLSFRRMSFPLVGFYEFGAGAVEVRLGAGAGLHSFEETWETVEWLDELMRPNLSYRGHAISPRLVMTVSFPILDRLSFHCSASYDPVSAGSDSALGTTVKIGGLQLLGGLAFRIF